MFTALCSFTLSWRQHLPPASYPEAHKPAGMEDKLRRPFFSASLSSPSPRSNPTRRRPIKHDSWVGHIICLQSASASDWAKSNAIVSCFLSGYTWCAEFLKDFSPPDTEICFLKSGGFLPMLRTDPALHWFICTMIYGRQYTAREGLWIWFHLMMTLSKRLHSMWLHHRSAQY